MENGTIKILQQTHACQDDIVIFKRNRPVVGLGLNFKQDINLDK